VTNPAKQPMIETLVFDGNNKVVFTSRDNYHLSYPNFFTERKMLKAGGYTVIIKPMWDDSGETSKMNKAEYRKILVGIYYPREA